MSLNRIPEKLKTVHFMGVCGTGMGSLAGMFKERGFEVTGSDSQVYPPMSTFLESLGINTVEGYSAANLNHNPDLVVVGNVIRRQNEEAMALAARKIPFVSFPQALHHFFLKSKTSLVVAGTHGKTTTASLLASVLEKAGFDPSFMIGGIVKGFGRNYKVGSGPHFVVEGDEYDTAFFDKGPKFLHYKPDVAVLTSVEFDHADIYKDFQAVKDAFRRLIQIMPPSGVLVPYLDDGAVRELVQGTPCRVVGYGEKGPDLTWRLKDFRAEGKETRFFVEKGGRPYSEFLAPLVGRHNALNALAVIAVLDEIGLDPQAIQQGLLCFQGVCRRQEIRGIRNGIVVIDDFAHHPTAVRETLAALKAAYPGGRLIAVFEPRTNSSRRSIFQRDYASSFSAADCIVVREAPGLAQMPEGDRFSSKTLVEDLSRSGKTSHYFADTKSIVLFLKDSARPGDIIAVMSNGGFDNIHERLLQIL